MAFDHNAAQELLGAFALDALDPNEADAVDVHLRDCPRCRAEVAEYRETASLLAFGGVEAPDGLWEKIVASLEEAPPRLELARVVPLPTSRWRTAGFRMVLAAAVVMSLLALAFSVQERRSRTSPGATLAAQLAEVSLNPATRHVHMVSADGTARAEVLILNGQGWLAKDALPQLSNDQTYQLWGQKGAAKVSLGVLGSDPHPTQFAAGADYEALAITAEKAPGVAASTNPAVVSGWVPTTA